MQQKYASITNCVPFVRNTVTCILSDIVVMNQHNLSQAAHVLASALANPYAQYSSHYAQALTKAVHRPTTAEGYTLSSTYTAGHTRPQLPIPTPTNHRPATQHRYQSSGWYQAGNCRCSYHGCSFIGSQKSVEIHMMDRHLIYPLGWEKRKKKTEWDADPSLKGKSIAIYGTNVFLDTPEALEAWITERKKRWPTTQRVAEKKRKLEEAIERGQILPQDSSFPNKRRRQDRRQGAAKKEFPSRFRADSQRKGKERETVSGPAPTAPHSKNAQPQPPNPSNQFTTHADFESGSSEDGDEAPEILSSRPPAPVDDRLRKPPFNVVGNEPEGKTVSKGVKSSRGAHRPTPKRPPHNPFASRPTLLRNLLLPEIRMTVSNLSQAIRFLVDNDFLAGVELTPGEADKKLVQVLDAPLQA
ncbi:hypothetical protein AX15_006654 [Amanita polypyramis BW_CC]|nr:hypothetical protein AX15_006654 [Amanita polypyramis BW_CC]